MSSVAGTLIRSSASSSLLLFFTSAGEPKMPVNGLYVSLIEFVGHITYAHLSPWHRSPLRKLKDEATATRKSCLYSYCSFPAVVDAPHLTAFVLSPSDTLVRESSSVSRRLPYCGGRLGVELCIRGKHSHRFLATACAQSISSIFASNSPRCFESGYLAINCCNTSFELLVNATERSLSDCCIFWVVVVSTFRQGWYTITMCLRSWWILLEIIL